MADIKSAAEIAMEKLEKLGEATEEERLKWKYVPEGEKLAAKYFRGECNLVAELSRYEEKVKKYIIAGAAEILIRHIALPKNSPAEKNNKKAMEGIKNLKSDKVRVENIFSDMRRLFNHYMEQGKQQERQAYESLKAEFEARMRQAVQQQLGTTVGMRIDAERQPQFQEQWRRVQAQLESQYYKILDEDKQELAKIP